MGQKVHPYGFRLGIIREPRSRWFAEGEQYRRQLIEDLQIRKHIQDTHRNAGISDIFIERTADTITVTVQTAKPGVIIGRGGRDVDKLRQKVEALAEGRVRVNVEETPQPDLSAQLMAENIARELQRRISPRRAMQQAVERAMGQGAEGARCQVSGRIRGAEIARTESYGPEGRLPLQTLRADIDYGFAEASTSYGPIGVKAWIYKGDILPPKKEVAPAEELAEGETQIWEGISATAQEVVTTTAAAAPPELTEEAAAAVEKEEQGVAEVVVEPGQAGAVEEEDREPAPRADFGELSPHPEPAEEAQAEVSAEASPAETTPAEPELIVAEMLAEPDTDTDSGDEEESS